jgi:hypothetical protein
MIRKILLIMVLVFSTFVFQKKIYNDLEKYADLKKETRSVADENAIIAS